MGEAINLASETKIVDLADKINAITGTKAGIVYRSRRDWDKVVKRRASIEKAKSILEYEPKTDIGIGLKKTYEWILRNNDKIEMGVKF